MNTPAVSVIIPVHNGEKTLTQCLDSVLNQNYDNYDVLVVDNNSTDKTHEIITRYKNTHARIRSYTEPLQARGAARRTGELHATGDIIITTDCDCVVPSDWISEMSKPIIHNTRVAVQGTKQPAQINYWTEHIQKEETRNTQQRLIDKKIGLVDTANFAIKASVLKDIGYTNPELFSGNDTDLMARLKIHGHPIDFTPLAVLHHHPDSAATVFRKFMIRGEWHAHIRRIYRDYPDLFEKKSFPHLRYLAGVILELITFKKSFRYNLVSGLAWRIGQAKNRIKHLWQNLKKSIELHRESKNIFWQGLVRLKDLTWWTLHNATTSKTISIDACSICQLKCPVCQEWPTDTVIGKGYLTFKNFKRFVDSNPRFKHIELSRYGEIFLNPELADIIKYAYTKNIRLSAQGGVNFNTVSDDMLECLVKYNFQFMRISIDGATNDIYQIYRRGGDLNRVIDNIKRLNAYKHKYKSVFPRLEWQFIAFGHNEHELPAAQKMADDLGMQFYPKLNISSDYAPVRNTDLVRQYCGATSQNDYMQRYHTVYEFPCIQLWISPQINWDGKLLGCSCNILGDFGNVFESGLKACLKSEPYQYAKKMLLNEVPSRQDIACAHCSKYNDPQKRILILPELKKQTQHIIAV